MIVRRASCLIAYWEDEGLAVQNYLSHRRVLVHPAVLQLISSFDDFSPVAVVKETLARLADASDLLSLLLEHDILIEKDTELDRKERLLESWSWGQDARFFHFATQDVQYTFDFDEIREHFEQKAKHCPPPSPFKSCGGQLTCLPKAKAVPGTFQDVLTNRRTIRQYSREPIELSDLAAILYWTWGKQRFLNESRLDRRVIKTSPSGGARHPIEIYPIVQRVRNVEAGIYHYSVERHGLELLESGTFEERMVEYYSGQNWVSDAAALFVFTAVLPRSMWKYDHSRAYRVVQLDAGHLGQTFHLVCTALGLAPFTTAAIQDRALEKTLQIDGVTEVVVYAAAVGRHAQPLL